ncbi:hypothetical protein P168DRAFT_317508 [Aspergillus campestris IBT 28561]|uniref:Uncharacterized protein n=1 Tax=Aspergillus campestris (strain IBT 28561) TaxID=1392248 RepID=A0A2I1D802_ASPC2|nr:uncharacterized protein P168DRAFT_317508 [Aspergillus campestris IBT 28561]PKY06006.1 hypothetical protein P168DRAFT_317508 [Aspergillus campestris IBT 28561]
MRLIQSLSLFLAGLSTVLADVEFVVPTTGTIFKAGDVVTAHWRDTGRFPRISDLTTYDLYLCTGGDTPGTHTELSTLVQGARFARGNSVSFRIDPEFASHEPNAYFLKMDSTGPEASVINLSQRFSVFGAHAVEERLQEESQNGSLEKRQGLAAQGAQGAAGAQAAPVAQAPQATGSYTIPYSLQTGPTRYAPQPKPPGTTIPPKNVKPTPQNPTSPYVVAITHLPQPTVETTTSEDPTRTVWEMENTAAPAPHPHGSKGKREG